MHKLWKERNVLSTLASSVNENLKFGLNQFYHLPKLLQQGDWITRFQLVVEVRYLVVRKFASRTKVRGASFFCQGGVADLKNDCFSKKAGFY